MAVLSFIAFGVFAVIDWFAVANQERTVEYVAKPAALGALTIFALTGDAPSGWLIIALVLSLLGDVYLMLPANLFAAGLLSFLLAHLAYIADLDASAWARLVWWVVVIGLSAPVALRIMRAVPDAMLRQGVGLYMAVIALMVASAFGSGSWLAAIGAVSFFVSDSIIAWDRFVEKLSWARPAIMVTYHLGQLGLVLALRG